MLEEAVSRQTDRVWAKELHLSRKGVLNAGDVVFHWSHCPGGRGRANLTQKWNHIPSYVVIFHDAC